MRLFLIGLFLCCFAVPCRLSAETADECVKRGNELRRTGDYDKAIAAYTQALALVNPKDPKDKKVTAAAYHSRGYAWSAKGEYDNAIVDFSQALANNPRDAYAYDSRGAAWDFKGEYDKAIADFNQALAINPSYSNCYHNRGLAWQEKGEYGKNIADQEKALVIDPKNYRAYSNLAAVYAACPDAKFRDGKKALENANKANQLTGGKDGLVLDILAAAYAESGDFDKAQEFAGKAIDLAPEKDKQEVQTHLELYKQGRPYRDELKKK